MAVQWSTRLPDLPMSVPPLYLAATGALWAAALTVCATGLLLRRAWSRPTTLLAVTLYQAHVWLNHWLFDVNEAARRGWRFDLAMTVLLLVLVWGLLNWPSVRKTLET